MIPNLLLDDFSDPLLRALLGTTAFTRLHGIHFLGGIDYLLVPSPNGRGGNIRHTRYEHSYCVGKLALRYSHLRGLDAEETRHVCAAALLHDVGHAPLSHSLEPVFKEVFEIEHHRATQEIVTGRVPLGREVYQALREHNADIERILALIAGDEDDCEGFFSGPINFDTIEGILRTLRYATRTANIGQPATILDAATRRADANDRETVDGFWHSKDVVYQDIIKSETGVLADYACQSFMRSRIGVVAYEDYFSSEENIFRKLSGLKSLLRSRTFHEDMRKYISEPISYTMRRFFVAPEGNFFLRDDSARYKQTKEAAILVPAASDLAENPEQPEREQLNDECDRASQRTF